jgi:16S rRNA (guanine966-N2)-methyltransferase
VRIVGGENRGLLLAEVGEGDANAHLRPTSDRVREAIFNPSKAAASATP